VAIHARCCWIPPGSKRTCGNPATLVMRPPAEPGRRARRGTKPLCGVHQKVAARAGWAAVA
jgi:hypothetical protein